MDNVRVNIQNKDLIKEFIESNPDLKVKINNAIIDGVSKRLLKNVLNEYRQIEIATNNLDERIEKAVAKYFQERLSK